MQQFTRALTREIEVGGERLAITLSKEGLSVRPVGGRRPPHTMSWAACLCACVTEGSHEPSTEQVQEALKAVRAGAAKTTTLEKTGETPVPPSKTGEAPVPPASSASRPPANNADKMTVLLARLDQWLNAERERFQQALRPGATAAECDALTAELGRPLPEELRALLMWHNGQNPDVPGAFEQNWMLMSTDEIAEAKKELDEHPHEGWHSHFLPFLGDDNGDYLCLDASTPGSPVLECWRGRNDHPVVAPSLSAWLEAFVTALERGAYAEDPERGTLALKEGIGNRG